MKTLSLAAGLACVATWAAAETPVLTVMTYDSFASEWGPGPAIEQGFEATCACDLRCDTELEACEDSVCVCRAGLTRCDGACVDTRADAANCDGCGKACGVGTVCADGACVASCGADQQVCGGACVDVKSDSLHCGDCGKLCPADELCLSGNCHPFVTIDGCDSCPCAEACESEDSDGESGQCCDAPFLGAPVCVQVDCS